MQTNMGILYSLMGNDGRGDWKEFREGPKKIQAVTAEDVRRVAQTYLTKENRGVATYTRKGGAAPRRPGRPGGPPPGAGAPRARRRSSHEDTSSNRRSSPRPSPSPARSPAADAIPARPEQIAFKPLAWAPPAAKDHRVVLKKSGVVAYLAENHDLPLVNVQILLQGGTYLNPPGKEGLAETTGWLLARGGTKKRKAEDLEERLAFLAAQLNPEQSFGRPGAARPTGYLDDRGVVTLNLLAKDLDEGLAILREVLTEPAFQEDRLKLRKDQLLAEMKQRNDSSASIEARERSVLLTGAELLHEPLGDEGVRRVPHAGRPRRVPRALGRAAQHDRRRRPATSGRPTWPRSSTRSSRTGRSRARRRRPSRSRRTRWPPARFLVDKDVNQGRVSILLPGLLRTDPDFVPAAVMNDILGGGGFTSRITNRVRSDEGLAYSAGSALVGGVWYPGRFGAAFQSKVRTSAYASEIVLQEMKKLRDGEVSDEELETAEALVRRHASAPLRDARAGRRRPRGRGVHRPLRVGPRVLGRATRRRSRRSRRRTSRASRNASSSPSPRRSSSSAASPSS